MVGKSGNGAAGEIGTDHRWPLRPSVRFSVESRGRKRKGVSENHDPCRGRREETPDDYIPNPEGNTAGVAGTSLAADRRAGSGDAEASGGRAAGGRTGSAGSPGPATRRARLSLGLHGAQGL